MAEIKSFVPHAEYTKYSEDEIRVRAQSFHQNLKRRRTVREFSDENYSEGCYRKTALEQQVPLQIVRICSPGIFVVVRKIAA